MKKPTWQSLQNRTRGRFLAPLYANFANSLPKLGINNVVTLDIEKNTAGTGTYKVALYCAADNTAEGGMRSVSKTVTLNGTESSTVTFDNVALYGGGNGTIYTYVKVALFNDADGYLAKSNRIDDMIDGMLPQKLDFEKVLTTEGKNHYYLFDDNYEKIRDCDLADGTVPTTIANFGVLESGIYTFFGYHNIDHSQFTKDHLYYEPVFYNTSSNGKVTMRKIGYSTLWDWNQVWADFSGKKVLMPEYYNSQVDGNEKLSGERNPTQNKYSYETKDVNIGTKLWFSDFLIPDENGYSQISEITENTIWIMMEFEVIEGSVIFETLAYSDKTRKNNIDIANIAKGNYEPDRQYKGTAYNAPCVSVDLNYCIDDSVFETGKNVVGLPLEIKNQFFENWYQPYTLTAELPDVTNRFTTHVNSYTLNNWRTAVENDIVVLNYEDDDGTMWIFNCERSDQAPNGILPKTDNGPLEDMLGLAGNFANFGVAYTYTIRISNTSQTSKYFCFDVLSQGNHIYDYTISYSNSDVLIQSDQTLKIVDLAGDIDKWDSIVENVELRPGTETTIVLNLTMTTACNSTIQNYLYVKKEL